MLIKNPREDNLIQAASRAASKKKAKADVHVTESPKKEVIKATKSYELQKCLSGDDTLILSDADVLSMNDTLVMSGATINDADEASEDEMDDALLPLEDNTPPVMQKSLFLTEAQCGIFFIFFVCS